MTETTYKAFPDARETTLGPITELKRDTKPYPGSESIFNREIRIKNSEGAVFVLNLFGPTDEDFYVTFSDSLL